jgi:hypothetical protein
MRTTVPFYSIDEEQKLLSNRTYHNHSQCPVGQSIPQDKRENGTNGYEICPICRQINQPIPLLWL